MSATKAGKILPVLFRRCASSMPLVKILHIKEKASKKNHSSIKTILKKYLIRSGMVLVPLVHGYEAGAGECHQWPLRESRGEYAYDGDTIYIQMPGLSGEIADMSVRVAGIDTPEIRGKCVAEKAAAVKARDRVREILAYAVQSEAPVQFCNPSWGRYGGRVVAWVTIGDVWLHEALIAEGHARSYDGGKREGWCDDP